MLTGARDFLLRAAHAGAARRRRRFDQLTFEIQEAIAPALYPDAQLARRRRAAGGRARRRGADARLLPARARRRAGRPIGCSRARACRRAGARASRRSTPRSSRSTASSRSPIRGCSSSGRARWCGCSASRSAEKLPVYGHTRELVAETIAATGAARRTIRIAARAAATRRCVDLRDAAQPSAFEVMHQLGILSRDHAGVGAVHRARAARPLSRVHGRPAPALRGRDAEADRARRARGRAPARDRAVARGHAARRRCCSARCCTTSASRSARATPRRARCSPARSRGGSA